MIFCVSFIVLAMLAAVQGQQSGTPPPPPFLVGAPPAKLDEFHKLMISGSGKTDAQIDNEVENWIVQQSSDIKKKFADFKSQMKEHEMKAEMAHRDAISKFSPAAREADSKLSAIANNRALSAQQKGQEIEKIISALSPTVRSEIENAMQG